MLLVLNWATFIVSDLFRSLLQIRQPEVRFKGTLQAQQIHCVMPNAEPEGRSMTQGLCLWSWSHAPPPLRPLNKTQWISFIWTAALNVLQSPRRKCWSHTMVTCDFTMITSCCVSLSRYLYIVHSCQTESFDGSLSPRKQKDRAGKIPQHHPPGGHHICWWSTGPLAEVCLMCMARSRNVFLSGQSELWRCLLRYWIAAALNVAGEQVQELPL